MLRKGLEIKRMVVISRFLFFSDTNLASREPGSWKVRRGARIDPTPLGAADIVQVNCVDRLVSLSVVEAQKVKSWKNIAS